MPHVSKKAIFSEKGIKNARLATLAKCPALELERFQLPRVRNGGRNIPPHRLILGFFEHEKIKGLMNANSEWLEESDPDDPPTQSENKEGRTPPPPSKRRRLKGPSSSYYNGVQSRWKPATLSPPHQSAY